MNDFEKDSKMGNEAESENVNNVIPKQEKESPQWTMPQNEQKTYQPPYPPQGNFNINVEGRNKKRSKAPLIAAVVAASIVFLLVSSVVMGIFISSLSNLDIFRDKAEVIIEDIIGGEGEGDENNDIIAGDKDNNTDTQPIKSGVLSVSQIAKKVTPSVVGVLSQIRDSFGQTATGSGIVMSEDGYIITNNHVIQGASSIKVVLNDGNQYTAKVVGADAKTDLAVLKIDAKGLTYAEFGNSDALEVGELAVAIGNPAGLELQGTVTSGIISAINRDITVEDRVMTLIQTDASINPGNSGGPLVNKYGQVIGVNTIKLGVSYYEGIGFAIPSNTFKPIIDELIANGYVKGRPMIGITGRDIDEQTASAYEVPMGVYIQFVDPGSDSYAQGLKGGDIIVAINDQKITNMAELNKIKDKHKAGESIKLTIYRDGKNLTVSIKLSEQKPEGDR